MYRQLAVGAEDGNLQQRWVDLVAVEGCPGALSAADMIGMAGPQSLLGLRPEQVAADEKHTAEVRERSMALHTVDKYIGLDRKGLMAIQADMHLLEMVHLRVGMAVAASRIESDD